jgi:hypothetical protein
MPYRRIALHKQQSNDHFLRDRGDYWCVLTDLDFNQQLGSILVNKADKEIDFKINHLIVSQLGEDVDYVLLEGV